MTTFTNLRLLSLLCLTTPLLAQGAETDLRIAAKKGNSVWLLQETKQEQTMDVGGQQMEMGNTTVHTLQVTIKDIDDKGNLVVETKIVRVHGSMTLPMMGDVDFDSAKKAEAEEEDEGGMGMPSPGAMTKMMTALAGKSFVAKIDPFGKVASLEGVAEILKEAAAGGGGMGGMGMSASESTFRQFVEGSFGVRPNKPMAQGATWEHVDDEETSRVPMRSKLKMTLAKVEADKFEVTATGTVDKRADEKETDENAGEDETGMREMLKGMKIRNGKVNGMQSVSRQDGFVVDAKNVTTMDMDMEGPMGAISMKMKSTTTTKRTTAEAAQVRKEEVKKEEPKKDDAGKPAPAPGK